MNPFDKYFGGEDKLQIQVTQYLSIQYPKIFWSHATNESRRSPFERYKAIKFGIRAGIPDIMIYDQKRIKSTDSIQFAGLAIELKFGKNKPTDTQKKCLEELRKRYWATAICYTLSVTIIRGPNLLYL